MENNKKHTGKYSFYCSEKRKGRPNDNVRNIICKIKDIEKKYPELFYEVLDTQGICKNIDELNLLYKVLDKKIYSYNKSKTEKIWCRFSENEISFFKNELNKQVESGEWKKKNSFNGFVSKLINIIIEQEKQVPHITVFKQENPNDKEKYDDIIPLKVYESPNVENPNLKKKLGNSTPMNINQSNFDWIELVCKSLSVTKSYLIRECLYSYRIKMEINQLQKFEIQMKNELSSIIVSEELKIEDLEEQNSQTEKSEFNPFEQPVIERDYGINNENIPIKNDFYLDEKFDSLIELIKSKKDKDLKEIKKTIFNLNELIDKKNQDLFEKNEKTIYKNFDFIEHGFRNRIKEIESFQSDFNIKIKKFESEIFVLERLVKETEIYLKNSNDKVKWNNILNVISFFILIFIVVFLFINR